MKKLLITLAVLSGLLLALIQLFAMIGATGNLERLVRGGFAGILLLAIVIAYQKNKRPEETDE